MSPAILIAILVFVGIAAVVGAAGLLLGGDRSEKLEDRLDVLTGAKAATRGGEGQASPSVLAKPLEFRENILEKIFNKYFNLGLLLEQADTSLTYSQFLILSAVIGFGGALCAFFVGAPLYSTPLLAIMVAGLPFLWLLWRRRSRLKKFASQMPQALEMLGRALRSGQSLPHGFNYVAKEMEDPIATEFNRVAEEQNFGIPLDDSLEAMAERVPNLDLRFFCTAVILQRQTGGDLAEILDKLGHLIRERFQIWGQIQALTGEGRLSGAILLAMPIGLFAVMYYLNPSYTMLLIDEPIGRKMLAGTIVMQLLGALVIKKIITIKV